MICRSSFAVFVIEVLALQSSESPRTRNTTTVWPARGVPEELWGLLGRLGHPCVGQTAVVFRYLSLFRCCVCCCGALQSFESPKTRNTTTIWPARGAPEELSLASLCWPNCSGVVRSSQESPRSTHLPVRRSSQPWGKAGMLSLLGGALYPALQAQ